MGRHRSLDIAAYDLGDARRAPGHPRAAACQGPGLAFYVSIVRGLGGVLAADGGAVITVPYTALGFTSFLELLRVKTVHDAPGPEHHVRRGYDERALDRLLAGHGLEVVHRAHDFRFFTRLTADAVSLAHLLYQRLVHRRASWTWADATAADGGIAFAIDVRLFPLLAGIGALDRLLHSLRGFGLVAAVAKQPARPSPPSPP